MPPEIVALLEKPWLLLMLLALGAALGMFVERLFASFDREKRRAYWRGRNSAKFASSNGSRRSAATEAAIDLSAQQLRHVMQANFEPRQLLNQSERRLLMVIDSALAEHAPGWRAMGQVSLGEIIWSKDKDAFLSVNSKRVDLLIVDADCRPLHAIEFQGKGHHLNNNTAARDAVKKEALRRAGIGYVEVMSGDRPGEVREMIRKLALRVES